MSNNNQFAIVPVPHHPGHAKDYIQSESILIGPMSEALQGIRDSVAHTAMLRRLDEGQKEAARVERTQAATRIANCAMLVDGLDRLSARLDSYEAELAIRREREAEEAARKDVLRIRHRLEAALDDLHQNTGDLSPLPDPSDPDASLLDDQLTTTIGTRSANSPSELDSPPDPKQVGQPIAVQLNEV
jgi:hypothetical protein